MTTKLLYRFFLAGLLAFVIILPARASSVLPLYLDQIIDGAAVAFQGTCIENRTERDSQTGLIVTYTSFQVQDVLKGQVESTHTIKQAGGQLPGPASDLVSRMDGVPSFRVGASYVVFLYGVSAAGFSSPVGLAQGKFSVLPGPAGLQVSNGRKFGDMTANRAALVLPQSAQAQQGQVPEQGDRIGLDAFKQLVRQRTAVPK